MKKILKYIPILLFSIFFSSCLEHGLEDLPTFEEAKITNMRFEYRWINEASEYSKLELKQLNTNVEIDTIANTVNCTITVPAVKDNFTESVRSNVSLVNIVGYADISTAAVMKPIGDAPILGTVGDFSKSDIQYEVKAADGTIKIWSLSVSELIK